MPATTQQIIAGLYAAFYNRAPDKDGLAYWENRASSGNTQEVFNEIAAGFASHPKFSELYDGLNNQQFVEAIYVNVLGFSGDTAGISFWTNAINNGTQRSDMVAEFVFSALNIDLNDAQWDSLTEEEKDISQNRQDTLLNKVDAALYFVDTFGDATNVTLSDDLENDPAYLASIEVLANIDHTISSVFTSRSAVKLDGTGSLVFKGVDTTAPTATIALSDTGLAASETSTVTISFSEATTGLSLSAITAPNATLSALTTNDDGITYTALLTPTSGVSDANNLLSIDMTQVSDTAGNAGIGTQSSPNYTVNTVSASDTTAPTLDSSTPADNATAVAIAGNIVLTFSETVTAGTGDIVISDGSDTRTIAVGDAQVVISGTTVTINPTVNLNSNASYNVQLASGVIKDSAGNSYAGISDTTTLNFTTDTQYLATNATTFTGDAAADILSISTAAGFTPLVMTGVALNGGTGINTINLQDGSNIIAATVSNFTNLTFDATGATGAVDVSMTQSQHAGFTGIITAATAGGEVITISNAGSITALEGVETYILSANAGAYDVTIDANTLGVDITDNVFNASSTAVNGAGTLTGTYTLTGFSDVLKLTATGDITGANVTKVEKLDLTTVATITATMTQAQHAGFTGGITANGNDDIITFTTAGTITGDADISKYVLADGANSFTLGGAGQDVTGGTGADTFIMATNMLTGSTIIGGTGTDEITMTDSTATTTDLDNVSGVETITLGAAVSAINTVEALVANGATLTVDGSSATSLNWNGSLETDGGIFSITGSSGADVIVGGSGADTITAGGGTDTVTGGAGIDTITLGAAADTVVIGSGDLTSLNRDTVTDFNVAEDFIRIDASLTNSGTGNITDGVIAGEYQTSGAAGIYTVAANEVVIELGFVFDTAANAANLGISQLLAAGGQAEDGLHTFVPATFSMTADQDEALLIVYQSNNAYLYKMVEGADANTTFTADGSDTLTMVGIYENVAVGTFDFGHFIA